MCPDYLRWPGRPGPAAASVSTGTILNPPTWNCNPFNRFGITVASIPSVHVGKHRADPESIPVQFSLSNPTSCP
ncbi:hypothetical protein NLI96_g462 [Meripilus lineatus]|uniref:Uncharacterized protein n=1 Tax=Meripilus lineatus TaxID=2056292 RepID=A0AAD5VHY0_9APHY|nr:hypothetical protein NLI96_g462 [Physisporinus lineatus]